MKAKYGISQFEPPQLPNTGSWYPIIRHIFNCPVSIAREGSWSVSGRLAVLGNCEIYLVGDVRIGSE